MLAPEEVVYMGSVGDPGLPVVQLVEDSNMPTVTELPDVPEDKEVGLRLKPK